MTIRVWHISDVHLSMDDNMEAIKKMHERKWAIGAWTFVDYIPAIAEFAQKNITDNDITFITGDIVHDMWGRPVYNSLNWLRNNIPGHIVICRGNHDRDWQVGKMKMSLNIPRFHIMGEGEIIQLGPFTIGCYSDHAVKTDDMSIVNEDYVKFANEIVSKAGCSDNSRIPIMISHYPVSPLTADLIAKSGVRAYMSGHVHCTEGNNPESVNGVNWTWYNLSAGLTDDKYIRQCFFSTGTVDVLRAKHGQPFKEIECLRQHVVSNQEIDRHRGQAGKFFKCNTKAIDRFHKVDPFNPRNIVSGLLCREKGLMQGSLLITHVNGVTVTPQQIYGTPKLAYPYINDNSRKFKDLSGYKYAAFMEKWNGMNVLFYQYMDAEGRAFITAKSKGTAFLNDSEVGNFLTLTKAALTEEVQNGLFEVFTFGGVSAVSFELCGIKEPHLVKYDFDICLKPLFYILPDGNIRPHVAPKDMLENVDIVALCKEHQQNDLNTNNAYRTEHGLPHRYEYEHFAVEGKVLFLMDENYNVIDRTLYKVKPLDIEEVHWQTFNNTMQGRVKEALLKIKAENSPVCEDTLRTELDMGPKEWNKFGRAVMAYLKESEANIARMVVLVGLPGSGKSTVAKELEKHGFVRVNQDDLGSRSACKKLAADSLKAHKNVVIDRCNFDGLQRKAWLDMATSFALTDVKAYMLDVPQDVCITRAGARENHPTIHSVEEATNAVTELGSKLTYPNLDEGFTAVKIFSNDSVENIVNNILENQ